MSDDFVSLYLRYARRKKQNAAWTLLNAGNSSLILAFFGVIFDEKRECPRGEARSILEDCLQAYRSNSGDTETSKRANDYIAEWIRDGFLEESANVLNETETSFAARHFAMELESKRSNVSKSRLGSVQAAVRELADELETDADKRIARWKAEIETINRRIDRIRSGDTTSIGANDRRASARNILDLMSSLRQDFIKVEDSMRVNERRMHDVIRKENLTSGGVIALSMDLDDDLMSTEIGQAFKGFYSLLNDENLKLEMTENIATIVAGLEPNDLTKPETAFLKGLLGAFRNESARIFKQRTKINATLSAHVTAARSEDRATMRKAVNSALEAISQLKQAERFDYDAPTPIRLEIGAARFDSPYRYRLKDVTEAIPAKALVIQENSTTLDADDIERIQHIRIGDVVKTIRKAMERADSDTLTVKEVVTLCGLKGGLEMVSVLIQIAFESEANSSGVTTIEMPYKDGWFRAAVPNFLYSVDGLEKMNKERQ